ncbi:MAG: hypothetical protein IT175_12225 [Acidobacteria bacterium]|nr:hypothetical protein [Acidobacteriota bacterium]
MHFERLTRVELVESRMREIDGQPIRTRAAHHSADDLDPYTCIIEFGRLRFSVEDQCVTTFDHWTCPVYAPVHVVWDYRQLTQFVACETGHTYLSSALEVEGERGLRAVAWYHELNDALRGGRALSADRDALMRQQP